MKTHLSAALAAISLCLASAPLQAGVLLSPAARWQSIAFRPIDAETTPNYYGYGGSITAGYSFGQDFDLAGYFAYTPATREEAQFGKEDALLMSYGIELALRFNNSVYFALRGGEATYRLLGPALEGEVAGRWAGPVFGVSLGAIQPFNKQNFLQASLDLAYATMARADADSDADRKLDAFSVTLAYVFNAKDNLFGGVFRDFVNSFSGF